MLLVRHSIPEATVSDFWMGNLNENFITNLLLTDTHSNTVKETEFDKKPRLLDMKFAGALSSIKSSTRFKWAITVKSRCFRGKPSEKINSYSRVKDRSLGIEKKMIIVYTIIMTKILVMVKKKILVIILLRFLLCRIIIIYYHHHFIFYFL